MRLLVLVLVLLTACTHDHQPQTTARATPSFENRVRRSIVRIENRGRCNVGVGTGWVLDETRIVTNSHMIEGDGKVDVELWHGATLTGTVDKASPARDLAIVTIPAGLPAPLPLATEEPTEDTELRIAGFPLATISRSRPAASPVSRRSSASLPTSWTRRSRPATPAHPF